MVGLHLSAECELLVELFVIFFIRVMEQYDSLLTLGQRKRRDSLEEETAPSTPLMMWLFCRLLSCDARSAELYELTMHRACPTLFTSLGRPQPCVSHWSSLLFCP